MKRLAMLTLVATLAMVGIGFAAEMEGTIQSIDKSPLRYLSKFEGRNREPPRHHSMRKRPKGRHHPEDEGRGLVWVIGIPLVSISLYDGIRL